MALPELSDRFYYTIYLMSSSTLMYSVRISTIFECSGAKESHARSGKKQGLDNSQESRFLATLGITCILARQRARRAAYVGAKALISVQAYFSASSEAVRSSLACGLTEGC